MNVATRIALPAETAVEITIKATLGELAELQGQLRQRQNWSVAGSHLLEAINSSGERLRAAIEGPVTTGPEEHTHES